LARIWHSYLIFADPRAEEPNKEPNVKEGEIAAALGMAEKTVSAHLHRARRTLIAQLGPDYPFAGQDPEGTPS
jgi:sigma-70-like protein